MEEESDLVALCRDKGVCLVPFDDGHVPVTFKNSSSGNPSSSDTGFIARRSTSTACALANVINICEDALPSELADEIYDTVIPTSLPQITKESSSANKIPQTYNTWGEYVTVGEARKRAEEFRAGATTKTPTSKPRNRKEIAIDAVAHYFVLKLLSIIGVERQELLHNDDIHGVAVWVLAADLKSEVEYHIDYAELIRYEYNITYPPIYGATVHCSRLWSTATQKDGERNYSNTNNEIVGGDFVAFLDGLEHYEKHGYKGSKKPVVFSSLSNDDNVCIVPYKFNQGILIHGEIPHASTPITYIDPKFKRVIMGFNVFDTIVGPLVSLAPEHSPAFNRRIKLYQSTFNLNTVLANKPLARLLVQAKRQKLKRSFWQEQEKLRSCLLQLQQNSLETPTDRLTVDYMFDALSLQTESDASDIYYAISVFLREQNNQGG